LYLDLEKREARLWTANVSHHNGDFYGEEEVQVGWGKAMQAVYPHMRDCAFGWLRKKREEEAAARKKAEMEAAYRKLVGEPEAKTYFERLLGD